MGYQRKTLQSIGGLAVVAIVGFFALRFAIAPGIGLNPDSIHYLDSASYIAGGQGYATPFYNYQHPLPIREYIRQIKRPEGLSPRQQTQYPPLFSFALACIVASADGGSKAIQILFPLFFGINVFLAGCLAGRMTSQNSTSIILAGILVSSAEGMLDVHTQVLSEPLFLTFMLLSLLSLSVYSETRRWTAFFLASAFAGAALLTRFVGLALVISGALGLLLLDHRPWKKRLPSAFAYAALASLPCLLFLLRNVFLTGSLSNRPVGWTPAGFRLLMRLLPTLSNWIFPGTDQVILPDIVRVAIRITTVLAFVGLATFLFVWRKRERAADEQKRQPNGTIFHTGLFLISYFAMSFGLIFLDKEMTFDLRILVPTQVVFLVFLVGTVHRAGPFFVSIRTWGVRLLVAIALFHLISAGVWISVCHDRGRGYHSGVWSAPAVRDIALMVKQTPERVPIFSNSPAAVKALSDRYAYYLPFVSSSDSLSVVQKSLSSSGPAVFVFFMETARLDAGGLPVEAAKSKALYLTQLRLTLVRENDAVLLFRLD